MASPKRSPEWLHFYNNSFLRGAHQLIFWGYQDARHRIHAHNLEEEITGFIIEAIRKKFDDPTTPRKFKHYELHEESYVRSSKGTGRSRQRLDIVAVCSFKQPRPEFIFEAKLLRRNGFPISLYTGAGGMQCFIKGKYAADYPAAAMIGYMQTDNASRWFAELERRFRNDRSGDLRIKAFLRSINVIALLRDESVSVHGRDHNTDIQIFHIFLDCT